MLYIVGTPLGNLNDLSYRQAVTLSECDIIMAEDTRSYSALTSKMLELFKLSPKHEQRVISYYKDTEFEKLPEVIEYLKSGQIVGLISESGMPVISDPGYLLVREAIKQNLPFDVIPGATAVTTAIVLSGFNPKNFMYLGFFPKKDSEIKKLLSSLKDIVTIRKDIVFAAYESPNRVNKTLQLLANLAPDMEIAVCRELTKKFQEVVRGKPSELMDREYRGEITLVFSLR